MLHSWSDSIPAEIYFFRSSPVKPGACPSTLFPNFFAISIFAKTSGFLNITPGKFIISANPNILSGSKSKHFFVASLSKFAKDSSNSVAGTQDETIAYTDIGKFLVFSNIYFIPSIPHTFAISCGSVTTAVVPCILAIFAKSSGEITELSKCIWPSINPGVMYLPVKSFSSFPEKLPFIPTILPSFIAISPSTNSLLSASKYFAFLNTKSTFCIISLFFYFFNSLIISDFM